MQIERKSNMFATEWHKGFDAQKNIKCYFISNYFLGFGS
jgi:hypothetical protein